MTLCPLNLFLIRLNERFFPFLGVLRGYYRAAVQLFWCFHICFLQFIIMRSQIRPVTNHHAYFRMLFMRHDSLKFRLCGGK